jgi:6-pyruvoyltetrahydropterin/6-carboxytetrahydropterin synthase
MSFIELEHNIEVAHRLIDLKGKCEQIHGHSMSVEVRFFGTVNPGGVLVNREDKEFEFGAVKKDFREYLDTHYDHRLLLNQVDPFAGPIFMIDSTKDVSVAFMKSDQVFLPGLVTIDGDPTTEKLSRMIAQDMAEQFRIDVRVLVHETRVNRAAAKAFWTGSRAELEF